MIKNLSINNIYKSQVPRRTKFFLLISNNFYLIIAIPVVALILFLNLSPLVSISLASTVVICLALFWNVYELDVSERSIEHPHHRKSWNSIKEILAYFNPLIRRLPAWQISLIGWMLANIPISISVIIILLDHPLKVIPRLEFDLYWLAYIPVLIWISYRQKEHVTEWFILFWLFSNIVYSYCFFLIYGSFNFELVLHLSILLGWFLFLSFSIHYLFRRIASFRGQSELLRSVTEGLRNNRRYTEAFDLSPVQNGPDASIMEIAEQIGQTLLFDRVFILVRDQGNDKLYMKGRYGISTQWPENGWSIRDNFSITGWVAENSKDHLCLDTSKCDLFFNPGYAYPCKSEAAVPIIVDNICVGVIDVESDHKNAFHSSDIRLLWQIANSIGASLSYERHVSREVDKTQALLKQAAEIMTDSKNLDEALRKVAQNLREIFKADLVVVYKHAVSTCVPLPGLIVEGASLYPEMLGRTIRPDSRINELIKRSDAAYISPNADEDLFLLGPNNGKYIGEDIEVFGTNERFVRREKIKSMIYLRLGVGKDIVGSLFLNYRKKMHFPKRMIESLYAIVNVLSMGLILKRQIERSIGPLAGATPLAHSSAEAAFESVSRDFDDLNWESIVKQKGKGHLAVKFTKYKEKLDNLRREWTNLILVEQMHLNLSSMVEPISHLELKLHSMFPNIILEWNSLQFLNIPTNEFGEVVYKIIAEGVSNALVHARSGHIKLDCRLDKGQLRILIKNDGSSIDPDLIVKMNDLVSRPYFMDGSEKHTGIISILLDARRWFGAEWNYVNGETGGAELQVVLPLGIFDSFEDLPYEA